MDDLAGGARCHHCGDTLPDRPVKNPASPDRHAYCCEGCAAAARWISDAGLDDFYQLRSDYSARVGTDAVDLAAWDRQDVLDGHAHRVGTGRQITLLTDAMRCAACAWLIDRALAREPGVIDAGANAVTGRIRITWNPDKVPLSHLLGRLAALGYRPYLAAGDARERQRTAERNRWLLRLGVAGLGAMQAMMLAEALYLDTANQMPVATRDFFRWITFLVSTPVVFYSGWPFLAGAWRELRNRHVGMDTLIASSTLLAYFASLVETVRGGVHVWYDAAVMFVFLLLAARMLEQRARNTALAQVDALARARPAFATRERPDGSRETVPVTGLSPGDIACVAAGDTVPADGTLLDGEALFEEALLTGESRPVLKPAGDLVFAGTLCRDRAARIAVTHTGPQTRLSQLSRLVEQAQSHRPLIARVADRIGTRFVAGLMIAAAATWLAWRFHDPDRSFEVTLAMLVISCPCALSLSVPTVLAVAHGALARLGILATRAEALDTLARATDVVFDKTGTLGTGELALTGVEGFGDLDRAAVLAIAAALERDTRHPIAAAFVPHAGSTTASSVATIPGQGIEGIVDGRHWRLGQAPFAAGRDDDGHVWLGDGVRAAARFTFEESQRADAGTAIDTLRALGLTVRLASGDAASNVQAFAQRLDIADAQARQAPEDKLAIVRGLQSQGRIVAMVGDGLNDAPVLAGADVSIAMGDGAPLAHHAADMVMTGPTLMRLPAGIAVARRSRAIIAQNLAWALGYNVLALPVAALGLVTPWLAALGMALSSLVVTLNALRVARSAA